MSRTNQNPIARRRRPQAVVSGDSGFVLILVLPVAMLLMMTALSMVSRSNSATVAAARESRAQAARMAAEYGLNQLIARINNEYNCANTPPLSPLNADIEDSSPPASYTITFVNPSNLCGPPPVQPCNSSSMSDLSVNIEGRLTINSNTIYKQAIRRTLSICRITIPPSPVPPTPFRVRAVR